jgi:uncharacterized protein (TIGR02996 family)
MTEHELRTLIFSSPWDDRQRSIYADWLLERGDARGELIQLDLQIPQLQSADREAAVRKRAELLFANLGWVPVTNPRISRGFAEEMDLLAGEPPPDGPLVFPRKLHLRGVSIDEMRALLLSTAALTIEELDLDASLLFVLMTFPPTSLRRLRLTNWATSDLENLAQSPIHGRLRHLVIDTGAPVPLAVTRGIARIDLGPNVTEAEIDGKPELRVSQARLAEELRAAGHEVKPFEVEPRVDGYAFAGDTPADQSILDGLMPLSARGRDQLAQPIINPMPFDVIISNTVPPFVFEKRRRKRRRLSWVAILLVAAALTTATIWLVHRGR